MTKKEETVKRLNSDFQVQQVGDLSTADGLLEYLGVKGKPKETQREVVQAFITGQRWADPVVANYIVDLRDLGLID